MSRHIVLSKSHIYHILRVDACKHCTTICQLLVFWEKFSSSQRFCAASPRLKLGGDFTPRFRSASPGVTHGATSTRLGWPSGHSGQAGGDLKCFSTPSGCSGWIVKKTIGQIANPHAILSRRTTTIHKKFRVFSVFSGYNNNPKNKNFVSFRVFRG